HSCRTCNSDTYSKADNDLSWSHKWWLNPFSYFPRVGNWAEGGHARTIGTQRCPVTTDRTDLAAEATCRWSRSSVARHASAGGPDREAPFFGPREGGVDESLLQLQFPSGMQFLG